MIQNDIPLEAVLKYIKRERDKYKEKVDILTAYSKSLEQRVKSLASKEPDLEKAVKEIANLKAQLEARKALVSENKMLKNENEFMKSELKAFREDARKTAWFAQAEEERQRLFKKVRLLKKTLNEQFSINFKDDD